MPGPIKEYTDALREVDEFAAGESWDRSSFDAYLKDAVVYAGSEPLRYAKDHAMADIAANREMAEWAEEHYSELKPNQLLHTGDVLQEVLAAQEGSIRAEWLNDLQSGRLNPHALDSYFAGRVDQHNALIETTLAAHPELQQGLPSLIQYGAFREEVQQNAHAQRIAGPGQQDLITAYQERELAIAGQQQQQIEAMKTLINNKEPRIAEESGYSFSV